MFSDEMMERLFTHKFISGLSVGLQSDIVKSFEEILEDILEVNPYADIQSLFPTDDE